MTKYGVCYITKEPIVYNKGTKWERSANEFLYVLCNEDNGPVMVNELNAKLAAGETADYMTGAAFDLTNIDHFFMEEVR